MNNDIVLIIGGGFSGRSVLAKIAKNIPIVQVVSAEEMLNDNKYTQGVIETDFSELYSVSEKINLTPTMLIEPYPLTQMNEPFIEKYPKPFYHNITNKRKRKKK